MFCVLVVVAWGCVLGMELIISIQVTDHRQPCLEYVCMILYVYCVCMVSLAGILLPICCVTLEAKMSLLQGLECVCALPVWPLLAAHSLCFLPEAAESWERLAHGSSHHCLGQD